MIILRTSAKVTSRLVCFAHAGGGASFFRPWARSLPDHIELCAVQLPGRENLYTDRLLESFEDVMEFILPRLSSLTELPYAFFGHSFGGLVAFEAARRLSIKERPPSLLALSSTRAAFLPNLRRLSSLPDAELLKSISDLGGVSASALQIRELMQLTLPIIRADFASIEGYVRPTADVKTEIPIWACGGVADPWVDTQSLGAWSRHAGSSFKIRLYPGGHFYILENHDALTSEIFAIFS
jgi:surfactin synthase thioesterase subunit